MGIAIEWGILLSILFGILEMRRHRKTKISEIRYRYKLIYKDLLKGRDGLEHYYEDKNFDLQKLKAKNKKDYFRIKGEEIEFFWYLHDLWDEAYILKSVDKDTRKRWDRIIQSSLKDPVHMQIWEDGLKNKDFVGHSKFNKLISECGSSNGCRIDV